MDIITYIQTNETLTLIVATYKIHTIMRDIVNTFFIIIGIITLIFNLVNNFTAS